jgi:anti-sigma regulatory factor (Ser/Thr protein kinase)
VNFGRSEHKTLFAIRNSEHFRSATAEVEHFCAQFGIEYQDTLRYVLTELLHNVLKHGCSDFSWEGRRYPVPLIAQFTWHEKINEIHFIVADTGVKIKRHLSQIYGSLATDEKAIRSSLQPEVSGTFGRQDPYSSRNNAGIGLYLSSNIARKLRGDMYIGSGNGLVHVLPLDTTNRELAATRRHRRGVVGHRVTRHSASMPASRHCTKRQAGIADG